MVCQEKYTRVYRGAQDPANPGVCHHILHRQRKNVAAYDLRTVLNHQTSCK